jgi:hypothetical protein
MTPEGEAKLLGLFEGFNDRLDKILEYLEYFKEAQEDD